MVWIRERIIVLKANQRAHRPGWGNPIDITPPQAADAEEYKPTSNFNPIYSKMMKGVCKEQILPENRDFEEQKSIEQEAQNVAIAM